MAETTKEFVKKQRKYIKDKRIGLPSLPPSALDRLDVACDRLEGQQTIVAEFIAKAEETLK